MVVLFLAVGVIGCANPHELAIDQAFPNAASPDEGLILVGLRMVRDPPPAPDRYNHAGSYDAWFRRISPEGILLDGAVSGTVCNTPYVKGPCGPDRRVYRLVAAPAGRYVLDRFILNLGSGFLTNSYVGPRVPGLIGTRLREPGDRVLDPDRAFRVRPGAITYVGDLTFIYRQREQYPTVRWTSDADAAQKALGDYKNVRAAMQIEPVFGSKSANVPPSAAAVPGGDLTSPR